MLVFKRVFPDSFSCGLTLLQELEARTEWLGNLNMHPISNRRTGNHPWPKKSIRRKTTKNIRQKPKQTLKITPCTVCIWCILKPTVRRTTTARNTWLREGAGWTPTLHRSRPPHVLVTNNTAFLETRSLDKSFMMICLTFYQDLLLAQQACLCFFCWNPASCEEMMDFWIFSHHLAWC